MCVCVCICILYIYTYTYIIIIIIIIDTHSCQLFLAVSALASGSAPCFPRGGRGEGLAVRHNHTNDTNDTNTTNTNKADNHTTILIHVYAYDYM